MNPGFRKMRFWCVIATLCMVAVSCKEPDDGVTRYTVIGAVPSLAANLIARATVYEYNPEDVCIDSNVIVNPSGNTEYVFYPQEEASHLKVKLTSKEDTFRWGDTIFMIIPGGNVIIRVSPLSPYCFEEPKL